MGYAVMKEILKVENLSSSYLPDRGKLEVLEDINLTINKGELIALTGPSGCGKSTLLKVIAGFILPDSGSVLIKEKPLTGPDADRIMVFQDFNQLFPWKTVLQNVVFPLQVKKIGNLKEERLEVARHYLTRVQLDDYLNFYPHQLSGGMKQRVALARALVTGPEILLMDEPFGSLDGQTRNSLQGMLLNIWQEIGSTIIFVTHDIREAILISDRIAVMGKGPGIIKDIINNDLSRPRDSLSDEFTDLYQRVYDLL